MHHKTKEMLRSTLLAQLEQLEQLTGLVGDKDLREAMQVELDREISQEDYNEVKESLIAEGMLEQDAESGDSIRLAEGQLTDETLEDSDGFLLKAPEVPAIEAVVPSKTKAASKVVRTPANQGESGAVLSV